MHKKKVHTRGVYICTIGELGYSLGKLLFFSFNFRECAHSVTYPFFYRLPNRLLLRYGSYFSSSSSSEPKILIGSIQSKRLTLPLTFFCFPV